MNFAMVLLSLTNLTFGVPLKRSSKADAFASGRKKQRRSPPEPLAAIHEFPRFQISDHQTGDPMEVTAAR